ncbi:MAG: hypothetical protein ACK559_42010, partial [bacterium]
MREPREAAGEGRARAGRPPRGAEPPAGGGGEAEGAEPQPRPQREPGEHARGQAAHGGAHAVPLDEEHLARAAPPVAGAEAVADEGAVHEAQPEAEPPGAEGQVEVFTEAVQIFVEAAGGLDDLGAQPDRRARERAHLAA